MDKQLKTLADKLGSAPALQSDLYGDNLAIALCTYFEGHTMQPDDDPIDDEYGWGAWVIEQSNQTMMALAKIAQENNQQVQVSLPETDHRIYRDEEGTPTIQLGCGGVIISDTYALDDSYTGISFSLGQGAIGESHPDMEGKTSGQIGAFLKIVATKPQSLEVFINHLQLSLKGFGQNRAPALLEQAEQDNGNG